MKLRLLLATSALVAACATPAEQSQPEIERLEQRFLAWQELPDLQAIEAEAGSAEQEFTEITIESARCPSPGPVCWVGQSGRPPEPSSRCLWFPIGTWRGYGKFLRFTRLADPIVFLEAPGHSPIQGRIARGALCFGKQEWNAVIVLPNQMVPGVEYQLRPRNENEAYRWAVASGVTCTAD